MIKLYGLKNCDTCRKAKKWLETEGADFAFVDVRADGVGVDDLQKWSAVVGWETLLNRRGTTWRQLDDTTKADVDEAKAIALMAEHPALMKRPVFESGETVIVGFKDPEKEKLAALIG